MDSSRTRIAPTSVERTFGANEFIVSKTDRSGRITYVNDVFLRVAGYSESEVIGAAHSIVRHPDMPRVVFKLLWETIEAGNEIFAYVKNMAKNGDYYWVLAHVTPSVDARGNIIGYHSNRRVPDRAAVAAVDSVYRELLREEQKHSSKADSMRASAELLQQVLGAAGLSYNEYVFSLAS